MNRPMRVGVLRSSRRQQMGSWLSDAFSNIDLNPADSPLFQTTVVPALNVGAAALGVPIPAGTILNNLLTNKPVVPPQVQTQPQPNPQYIQPGYNLPPNNTPATPPASAAPGGTPASDNSKTLIIVGGVAALGLLAFLVMKPAPQRRAA